jgi:hypothetical protein
VVTTSESSEAPHRFILQAIGPTLDCPVLEAMLHVADLETLRSQLGEDASEDTELRHSYVLSSVQLRAIMERVGFEPNGREVWLSHARPISEVPYLVHTGYELALMLEGT